MKAGEVQPYSLSKYLLDEHEFTSSDTAIVTQHERNETPCINKEPSGRVVAACETWGWAVSNLNRNRKFDFPGGKLHGEF